jgi:hypothetical protein
MIHISMRTFGRRLTLQHDDTWAGRGLPLLWSDKNSGVGGAYHCGNWVFYVARAASGDPRVELELGGLQVIF